MQDWERGSMTLLGIWMLSIMLFVSAMLYIFSNKETEVSVVERQGYKMQLLTEGIMDRELLQLQGDFPRARELYHNVNEYPELMDEGDMGPWHYQVQYISRNNSLWLLGEIRNSEDVRMENVFGLRWRLHIDEAREKVILEGIG